MRENLVTSENKRGYVKANINAICTVAWVLSSNHDIISVRDGSILGRLEAPSAMTELASASLRQKHSNRQENYYDESNNTKGRNRIYKMI